MNAKKSMVATVVLLVAIAPAIVWAGATRSRVSAYSSAYWTTTLAAGDYTRIIVDGDGDTDLDLYVYDEYGNQVGRDIDYTDYCIVSFTPRRTGTYEIKIRNLGGVYNEYVLSVE